MQHKTKHSLALVASAAALALLAACGKPIDNPATPRTEAQVERNTGTAMGSGTERAGTAIERSAEKTGNAMERGAERAADKTGDAGVTAKAKAALLAAPELSALRIDVDTKGGVVTLKGEVKSLTEKSRAEQVVASVSGVQSVVNDLRVIG